MKIEVGYVPHTYQHQKAREKTTEFLSLYSLRESKVTEQDQDDKANNASLFALFNKGNEDIAEQLYEQMTVKIASSQFYR